eukprot:sb/3464170/
MASTWAGQVGGWLREALLTSEITDFTLTCVDGEVRCHKLLLLAQGGLLETRVRERMSDGVNRLNLAHLGIPTDEVKCIVSALYGGLEHSGFSPDNMLHYLMFADHFGIDWLTASIQSSLPLTPATALMLLGRSELEEDLKHKLQMYCRANGDEILKTVKLSSLPKNSVLLFLRSVESTQPQILLTAVTDWLSAHTHDARSCVEVVLELPTTQFPRCLMTSQLYDVIFTKLLIECSESLSKEDKFRLVMFYQAALTGVEDSPVSPPPEWREGSTEQQENPRTGPSAEHQEPTDQSGTTQSGTQQEKVHVITPPPPPIISAVEDQKNEDDVIKRPAIGPRKPVSFEVTLETPQPLTPQEEEVDGAAVDQQNVSRQSTDLEAKQIIPTVGNISPGDTGRGNVPQTTPEIRSLPPSSYRTHIVLQEEDSPRPPPSPNQFFRPSGAAAPRPVQHPAPPTQQPAAPLANQQIPANRGTWSQPGTSTPEPDSSGVGE